MKNEFGLFVPKGVPGAINTWNSAIAPLLAPAASESGALFKNGLSLTVKKEEAVMAPSPLRKVVLPVRFASNGEGVHCVLLGAQIQE
jgi:hypothetical protein